MFALFPLFLAGLKSNIGFTNTISYINCWLIDVTLLLCLCLSKTVKLVKDESMKRSKGYAFIQFMSQDDAFLAIETMDRRVIISLTLIGFNQVYIFLINQKCFYHVVDVQWEDDLYRHCEAREA